MTVKQNTGRYAPDSSKYGTVTDGDNTLVVLATISTATPKQASGSQAPDGSIYFCITDGSGNLT